MRWASAGLPRGISSARHLPSFPVAKEKLVSDHPEDVKDSEQQYSDGLITQGREVHKVVNAGRRCTDKVRRREDESISRPSRRADEPPDLHDAHSAPARRRQISKSPAMAA